jgi:hypothetical protein
MVWLGARSPLAGQVPGELYVLPEGEQTVEPPAEYVDLDAMYGPAIAPGVGSVEPWTWQLLPQGLIYRSYLAGVNEPRLAAVIFNEEHQGWLFDPTLGARVGLLRLGTQDPFWPCGFQIDVEGAAMLRLDTRDEVDVVSADYRAGVPLTFGVGRHRTKFAYYHLSSHVGDEFLIKNQNFVRLNYGRDVLVLGHSYYPTDWLRLYGEVGWSFNLDVSKPWEFQFGLDWASPVATGYHGAPFVAFNAHLREEVNFGGGLAVQGGWSWRSVDGRLLRTGVQYYNGKSPQFSFFDEHENQIGFGIWYDF